MFDIYSRHMTCVGSEDISSVFMFTFRLMVVAGSISASYAARLADCLFLCWCRPGSTYTAIGCSRPVTCKHWFPGPDSQRLAHNPWSVYMACKHYNRYCCCSL